MQKKLRIKNFLLLSLCLWVVGGFLVPMRLMPLLLHVGEFQNGRIGPDGVIRPVPHPPKFGFGVRFDRQDPRTTWLDEAESEELCKKIFQGILSHGFGEGDIRYGVLYIIPKWLDFKVARAVFYPFVHMSGIDFYFYPHEGILYLSEDRKELCYDFCKGLNVSNVPPELIHFERKQSPKE